MIMYLEQPWFSAKSEKWPLSKNRPAPPRIFDFDHFNYRSGDKYHPTNLKKFSLVWFEKKSLKMAIYSPLLILGICVLFINLMNI